MNTHTFNPPIRARGCVLALVVLLLGAAPAPAAGPARHLFLDPAFLQEVNGAALHVNPPQQREIVIRPDQPWEQLMISFFLTVRDEEGKLRMWYICRDKANAANVAYAESTDGVTWVKPKLGIADYHGSKENNLVGIPFVSGMVFRDPKAKPGQEYVYLANADQKHGIVCYRSPDGLHWGDRQTLLPFRADTQNVVFWDEPHGCYVLYLRGWNVGQDWNARLRKVVRLTLADLSKPVAIKSSGSGVNPTKPRDLPRIDDEMPTVLAADERDPKNTDVYNISAQPYPLDPRWYVGFPSFLLRERSISDGRLEVQFVGSRDGIVWQRYDRPPYVAPGLTGSESPNVVFMGTGLVMRGDEIWQYGTGFESRHGDVAARKRKTDGVIYRYVQRVDGFVSLDFAATEGKCVTAPVKVDGARLLLNVDTGALGVLRVGLLDADGKPLAGFSADECAVLRTNSTHAEVAWKGANAVSSLQGREVRLLFTGSRAKLYSFRFEGEL